MSSTVDQIKERLHVVDVISSYMKLEKAGANYKGKCPFHNEKTPSFFVSPERESFYCFGCSAKGDIFSFVQQFEGVDFRGALTMLAEKAGVTITREAPGKRDEKEKFLEIMDTASLAYEKYLGKNEQALAYLRARGLTDKTIKEWRIGLAPDEWKALADHLQEKGIKREDIEKVGLIKRSEKNPNDFYDRFRGRIMFPLFDTLGRVIAFSGRIMVDDGKSAKYINSPETPLFDKSKTLYGYHLAKAGIRKMDYTLLVEGQMDLLLSHQAGFNNAVASSGTALTSGHLELLKRLSNRLMIAYDADRAGIAASERGWQTALSLGMDVKVCALPQGKDPADLIKENLDGWKQVLRNATHIIDFYLNALVAEKLDARALGRKIQEKVIPYVAVIESSIERSHFISKISNATGIKEDALQQEVRKMEQGKGASTPAHENVIENIVPMPAIRKDVLEEKIMAVGMWLASSKEPLYPPGDLEKRVVEVIGKEAYAALLQKYEPKKEELLFQAEASYDTSKYLIQTIDELVSNLKEDHLKDQFLKAMRELQEAEKVQDPVRTMELLQKCQALSQEIRNLSVHT